MWSYDHHESKVRFIHITFMHLANAFCCKSKKKKVQCAKSYRQSKAVISACVLAGNQIHEHGVTYCTASSTNSIFRSFHCISFKKKKKTASQCVFFFNKNDWRLLYCTVRFTRKYHFSLSTSKCHIHFNVIHAVCNYLRNLLAISE